MTYTWTVCLSLCPVGSPIVWVGCSSMCWFNELGCKSALTHWSLQMTPNSLAHGNCEILLYRRNLRHWLHQNLSLWQLPVQSVAKVSSIWRRFRFTVEVGHYWFRWWYVAGSSLSHDLNQRWSRNNAIRRNNNAIITSKRRRGVVLT